MIFSSVASMLLCTRSHFLFVSKISPSLPLSAACHQVFPAWLFSSWIKIVRELFEQLQNCDWRFRWFGRSSMAVVANTEPDSNSAAPKRTLQLNMDADQRLPPRNAAVLTAPTVIISWRWRFTGHESRPSLNNSWRKLLVNFICLSMSTSNCLMTAVVVVEQF